MNGFQIYLFENAKGKNGATLQMVADLSPIASGIQFDTQARGGYGSLTCTLTAPLVYLEWLSDAGFGLHLEVWNRLSCVYEGMVTRADMNIGNTNRSLAMDDMTNKVIVHYGQDGRYAPSDSDSIARYGTKIYVESLGTEEDRASAQKFGDRFLAEHKSPVVFTPGGAGGMGNTVQLQITAQGYWWTLGWQLYHGRAGVVDTMTQVRRALKTMETDPGYLSTDYDQIATSSGIVRQQRTRDALTVQQRVMRLMSIGNSSGYKYLGGVGPNRKFFTFARPTTADYFYDAYYDVFRDVGGAVIPNHALQPGRFATNILNFNYVRHVSDVRDDPFAVFLNAVRYDAEQDRVDFDPPDAMNILRRIARKPRI